MGLMAAARDELVSVVYYLALVWSNGLLLYLVTVWLARGCFGAASIASPPAAPCANAMAAAGSTTLLVSLLFFLDPQTRLLIVKDFRTFRRDPAQWLQILIFLGLAVLYFSNMRRFYEKDIGRQFQNGISLLTLTATGFLMCAYTGPVHLPDAQPGGAQVLDTGPVAAGARASAVGQVRVFRRRAASCLPSSWCFSATGCSA